MIEQVHAHGEDEPVIPAVPRVNETGGLVAIHSGSVKLAPVGWWGSFRDARMAASRPSTVGGSCWNFATL